MKQKIFKKYGQSSIAVLQENPYRLTDDIWGIGFKIADGIAQSIGLPAVTGMHPDNPGAQEALSDIVIVPTGETSTDMVAAVAAMTRLASNTE